MKIRQEVTPFIVATFLVSIIIGIYSKTLSNSTCIAFLLSCGIILFFCTYFIYFFRDPNRQPPANKWAIVAGADGIIANITELHENKYLKTDCIRISIFLSLFDVHVNRAPISGESSFLGYFPGKRFFTFEEKSSDFNQHNKILIEGEHTRCLVNQIVGPVCRRVVYWPDHDKSIPVAIGERIGMMKFGSRLDMYFPKDNIVILAKKGDRVRAGETIVGRTITSKTKTQKCTQ